MSTKIEFEVSFIWTGESHSFWDAESFANWIVRNEGIELLKRAILEDTYRVRILSTQHDFGGKK